MTKFESIATELKSTQVSNPLSTQPSIERSAQVGFDPEQLIPTPTYIEAGIEKLTALAQAVGLQDKLPQIIEIFRAMTVSWGERKVGEKSAWQSDVSDDCAPFEFSIALDPDKVELRVLVEAQGRDPNLQSNWQAGLALNQYLAEHFNISLDRFQQIEDLFVPTNPEAKFSIWHSACFYPDKEPAFKLYLNPQSQVKSRAAAVVEESLVRLGFPHAWMGLAEVAAQRGPDKDDFVYFSIDLANHDRARVKVYVRHYDATVEDLEKALSLAENYVAGDATEFCQAMTEDQSFFFAKPVISAFSWVEGDNDIPSTGTLHLPISNYAPDDLVVSHRLDHYLIQHDLPFSLYHSAIHALATRSLDAGIGMHSYTSLRREQDQRRITLYLNPEVNAVKSSIVVKTKSATPSSSVEEMVWRHYEKHTLADHPFLQRLQRETVNPEYLWLLFMNLREWVLYFTRYLAIVVARSEDQRIRCILAKQLNQELGNGNINQDHQKLFDGLIANIEHWRMESFTEEMLAPGKEFSCTLQDIYFDPNPSAGVGAGVLLEIQAEQFDLCVGQIFRKTNIDLAKIKWLILHEEIEVEHADEALFVARLVDEDSPENVTVAIHAARKARVASWNFFNGLYRLCYGSSSATLTSGSSLSNTLKPSFTSPFTAISLNLL